MSTLNKETQREEWVDIAKGLAMIFVILLHCGASLPIRLILASFHMPLFFMLAGFFLFRKERTSMEFIRNKFNTLLIPYFIFGLILASYSTVLDFIKGADVTPGFRHIGLLTNMRQPPFYGSLWFLITLFSIEILLFYLHKLIRRHLYRITLCISIFCIGGGILCVYGKGLPLCFDLTLLCLIFCEIGYFIYPKISYFESNPKAIILLIIILIISVYLNYALVGESLDLYSSRLGNPLYFFMSAISGSILTILFVRKLRGLQIRKFLTYIGRNSLLFYCLQYLLILLVTKSLDYCLNFLPFASVLEHITPLLATLIIIIALIPIINYINKKHKWMLGKV